MICWTVFALQMVAYRLIGRTITVVWRLEVK